jgi:hypothetical protein
MPDLITIPLPGTLGTDKGADANGVLVGKLTGVAAGKFLLRNLALTDGVCITNDGGVYVNESTPFNNATLDDVEIMLTAINDANYFGHQSKKPTALRLVMGVQGVADATPAVVAWEYSKGAGVWGTLTGVTDGTTAFTSAVSTTAVAVTFTAPIDMALDTVDGVSAYWIRARHASGNAHATPAELDLGYIVVAQADGTFVDDTTDFNDAGANDCALLPAYATIGDGGFISHATEKFSAVLLTTGTAGVMTATLTWKYWNGASWATLTVVDDSVAFTAVAGALLVHFTPPSDWAANTAGNGPNGNAGYFIAYEISAFTSMATQPLLTSGLVYPLTTGAKGLGIFTPDARSTIVIVQVSFNAMTKSGATADSKFVLFNLTQGTSEVLTWTKATGFVELATSIVFRQGDRLMLQQVQEDSSVEFAGAFMTLKAA